EGGRSGEQDQHGAEKTGTQHQRDYRREEVRGMRYEVPPHPFSLIPHPFSQWNVYPTPNFTSGLSNAPSFASKNRPLAFCRPKSTLKPAVLSEWPPARSQFSAGPAPAYTCHGCREAK